MPTIIDSLIVTLGLDSKSLEAKSGSAGKTLKGLEEQGAKTEKNVKKLGDTSKSAASGVDTLAKSLGSFLAIIGGTVALRAFIEDTISSNAALDRFSKNLGLSVTTVSAWGNAVEELGGNAKGLQGSMDMLSKAQTELRLTGQSSLIPYFSALGVSLATVTGQAKPVDEILLDLADRFGKMDRTTANNMGRMMGLDQDTLNLLLKGRTEVELTIKRQKEYTAVTKAQAEESSKLQKSMVDVRQSFAATGRELLQSAAPALEKFFGLLKGLGDWIAANKEVVTDFLTVMAIGVGALALAFLPIDAAVVSVLALAAGIALLWQDYQTWKRGGDSLIDWEKWKVGIDKATELMDGLAEKAKAAFKVVQKSVEGAVNALNGNWAAASNSFNEAAGVPLTKSGGSLGKLFFGQAYKPKTTTNAPQTGNAAAMQKYFQDRGWSPSQAAGIVANLMSESGGRSNAVGDKGSAYGVAQWHKDRQANFAKFAGHDIKFSTLDEQLSFVNHELRSGTEMGAGRALGGATDAASAGSIVSRLYERPADASGEASRRGSLAASLAGYGGGGGGSNTDKSVSVTTGDINIHTAATDATGISKDISKALNFQFISQANTGLN